MPALTNKRILLAVCGGIAAYKAAETVRRLRDAGAEVRVIMTRGGLEFITPLTLQALSGNPVHTDLLDPAAEAGMGHIELARWADLLLVAPATADSIASLTHGRADDLLGAVWLATEAPRAIAPAMNQQMWQDPATQANLAILKERQVAIWGPASGEQACGEIGPGRMLEADQLAQHCAACFQTGTLQGVAVVITAGPTREPIDPVRFISNRSSGKMGYALAGACRDAGARVTLISGPTCLEPPERVARVQVGTALEMEQAVTAALTDCQIFIGTAAVSDYRPAETQPQKIKKSAPTLSLELVRNPDIIAGVAAGAPRPFCVGFAAETHDLSGHAWDKLQRKGLDLLVGNEVGSPDRGMDSDHNAACVYHPDGRSDELALQEKHSLARRLVEIVAAAYQESHKGAAAGHEQDRR